ncbi:MAG: exodeoxyribonuclease VII small subunit [Clostridiales bacterium]|nr:exodeoxyribonuclease VII small subunit [Clostridiales bacterium]
MDKMTFEQAVLRIDEIVKTLEKGDAPLEQSLTLFEEGTNLIKFCGKLLDNAEQKVVRLQKGPDGKPEETDFDVAGE